MSHKTLFPQKLHYILTEQVGAFPFKIIDRGHILFNTWISKEAIAHWYATSYCGVGENLTETIEMFKEEFMVNNTAEYRDITKPHEFVLPISNQVISFKLTEFTEDEVAALTPGIWAVTESAVTPGHPEDGYLWKSPQYIQCLDTTREFVKNYYIYGFIGLDPDPSKLSECDKELVDVLEAMFDEYNPEDEGDKSVYKFSANLNLHVSTTPFNMDAYLTSIISSNK